MTALIVLTSTAYPDECHSDAVLRLYEIIIARQLDLSDQAILANAIVALLKYVRHQRYLVMEDQVMILPTLIIFFFNQQGDTVSDYETLSIKTIDRTDQGPEDEEQLQAIRSTLSAALWDTVTLPEFVETYPPNSDIIKVLGSWISASEAERQLCACSVLRNYVSSDKIATQMVEALDSFRPLTDVLMTGSDLRVVEEALRLLRNLALPFDNRTYLASFALLNRLVALTFQFDSPTLHTAAISLIRQIIKGSPAGVALLLQDDSEAEILPKEPLSGLVEQFKIATDLTVRMEIGRTIVEVWRTSRNSLPTSVMKVAESVLEKSISRYGEDVVRPLLALVTESGNPSLVTEGWFGLILMANSKAGGDTVWNSFRDEGTFAILKSTVMDGRPGSKDQDNARILVNKLLWRSVSLETYELGSRLKVSQATHSPRRTTLELLLSGIENHGEVKNPGNHKAVNETP